MNTKRIPGFQWAMSIFIFYIIAFVLPLILKDFQSAIPFKTFVFEMSVLAPFIAAILCLIIFKNKRAQLGGLKFSISIKVIERLILALILPLAIFIIAMVSFNVFADSFVLLQSEDLSVSIFSVIIGQLIMAFFVEFGFRSYLQHIVETKISTFFASVLVGMMYAIWNINIAFSFEYTLYNLLYSFAFSMIIGELIRATKGRTIFIATLFHAAMSFGLVFLFNEELGYVFSMKVIALSTTAVAAIYIILSYIIRIFFYFFTKRNLDEVDDNNYLDHVNEHSDNVNTTDDNQNVEQQIHDNNESENNNSDNYDNMEQHQAQQDSDGQETDQDTTNTTINNKEQNMEDNSKSQCSEQRDEQNHPSNQKQEEQTTHSSTGYKNNYDTLKTSHSSESEQTVNTDYVEHNNTQSAVETSTEKAKHDEQDVDTDDELRQSARYKSDRKSSVVSDVHASIANDEQTTDSKISDDENDKQNNHKERSSFKFKNNRGHRR